MAVILVALFLGGEALRAAYVAALGESVDVGALKRAIALDPSNPELHHRLGMVLCDSLGAADRTEGLIHLRRATELDPYAARYWSDLAWVCELDGDTGCATQGIKQAVELSPATPRLHWMAANAFLRMGQTAAAMAEFRRLLELDPAYAPATFHICMGSVADPQVIVQKVLPLGKDPRVKLAFLNFLTSSGLIDQAHLVWAKTVEAGTAFPLSSATPYIDQLLALGRFDEAQQVWRDLERLGVVPNLTGEQSNMVFNGDFEETPLNAGFDWRNRPGAYIALDFSDPSAHSGKRCLRIDFTVSRNEEYVPLFQLISVVPKQAYLLTAFVRSQDITSDSGPRLQLVDPVHPNVPNGLTETTTGTTPWHPISLSFCTGPDTRLVQLSIIRVRGRTFPTEIAGSFWLDSVVMKPVELGDSACTTTEH